MISSECFRGASQACDWVDGERWLGLRLPSASPHPQCLQGWQQFEDFPHHISSCLSDPTLFCRLLQRSVRQSFKSGIKLVRANTAEQSQSHIHLTLKPLRTMTRELPPLTCKALHPSAGTVQTPPPLSLAYHRGASRI